MENMINVKSMFVVILYINQCKEQLFTLQVSIYNSENNESQIAIYQIVGFSKPEW
jgi:hypothetical protein